MDRRFGIRLSRPCRSEHNPSGFVLGMDASRKLVLDETSELQEPSKDPIGARHPSLWLTFVRTTVSPRRSTS